MVGHPALREIVGADALGTVAAADQRLALAGARTIEPIALDLTAYLLKVNKFPDGKAELTVDTAKTAIILK